MREIYWEDVQEYINSLQWKDNATNYEKTLVAGNISAFASWITERTDLKIIDKPIEEDDPIENRVDILDL